MHTAAAVLRGPRARFKSQALGPPGSTVGYGNWIVHKKT